MKKGNDLNVKVDIMSFEEAMKELEIVVKKMDSGLETLESAIELFEYGNQLKNHCEKKLNEARLKIEKIVNKNPQEEKEDITSNF